MHILIQSGLISDEKFVNLLAMALAADTVYIVKGMRELLDAEVDALSLVAHLASLITNILAGTFEFHRESRQSPLSEVVCFRLFFSTLSFLIEQIDDNLWVNCDD